MIICTSQILQSSISQFSSCQTVNCTSQAGSCLFSLSGYKNSCLHLLSFVFFKRNFRPVSEEGVCRSLLTPPQHLQPPERPPVVLAHTRIVSFRSHLAPTLTFFPSMSTVRTLKSTPMVFCCLSEKIPDLKFCTTQVLPTLESPIRMILNKKSKESSCSGPGFCMAAANVNA